MVSLLASNLVGQGHLQPAWREPQIMLFFHFRAFRLYMTSPVLKLSWSQGLRQGMGITVLGYTEFYWWPRNCNIAKGLCF